jgi:2-polyprenyl-3-methyl-5-hydroxy-6-metoxy-1,4-benzoquinol methylase
MTAVDRTRPSRRPRGPGGLAHRETSALELMDDPDCDLKALRATYAHFALVNRLVSGWRRVYERTIAPLARSSTAPLRVLDIGSGAGDVARALAAWSRRDGHPLDVTAIDPDARAFDYASSLPGVPGVVFERATSRDLVEAGRTFDVVVSNHLLHHLDSDALGSLLDDSRRLATTLVVHNDIARGLAAFGAYAALTTGTFRGSFIHHDGLLSIRRSYRPAELQAVVPAGWKVTTQWPSRLLLTRDVEARRA